MQDIFVSTLPVHIDSWVKAFPDAQLVSSASDTLFNSLLGVGSEEAVVFWLHMNEDRQQWMANTVATIAAHYNNAKIVVLANVPNHAECLHALSLGAVGYAHAYSESAVLTEIKTVISHSGLWLGAELLQHLITTSAKLTGNQPEYVEDLLQKLTKREREVAIEAAKGLSNKEIARILDITDRTVKAHLAAIFERLGVKDRLQLALMLNKHQRINAS